MSLCSAAGKHRAVVIQVTELPQSLSCSRPGGNTLSVDDTRRNNICRDIFRAIHEGKWLQIEYRNRESQITKYWIGIRSLNPQKRTLAVDGLHLGRYTTKSYEAIYIDSILTSQIVEGSYQPVNE